MSQIARFRELQLWEKVQEYSRLAISGVAENVCQEFIQANPEVVSNLQNPDWLRSMMAKYGPSRSSSQRNHSQAVPSAALPTQIVAGDRSDQERRSKDDEVGGEDGAEEHPEDTYAAYKALAIQERFPGVKEHPDPLLESAALASIKLPQLPDNLDLRCTDWGDILSDAQLETVCYATSRYDGARLQTGERAGFFLGDGAGVGKGRQIAALVKEHWLRQGRHILWVSVSSDLRLDAARDLKDVNAEYIKVYPERVGQILPYGTLQYKGVLFVTYSLLVSGLNKRETEVKLDAKGFDDNDPDGEQLPDGDTNRGALKRKKSDELDVPEGARLQQIINWLKRCQFGGLIIFDECHKAKNLFPRTGGQPSQTAKAVVHLQQALPDAKVLYSSATGASEAHNLAYMTRLGLGFADMQQLVQLLRQNRLEALELAAMSLKNTGTYLARSLSYQDAEFGLVKVEVDPIFELQYDRACNFWSLLWDIVKRHPALKTLQALFWGSHQRFFKQMLMAAKVPACVAIAKAELEKGNCIVIGLQSTGEANTELARANGELNDLISAPRMILEQYIKGHFPVTRGKLQAAQLAELQYRVHRAVSEWKSLESAKDIIARDSNFANITRNDAVQGRAQLADGTIGQEEMHQVQREIELEECRAEEARSAAERVGWLRARSEARRKLLASRVKAANEVLSSKNRLAQLEDRLQQLEQSVSVVVVADDTIDASVVQDENTADKTILIDSEEEVGNGTLTNHVLSPVCGLGKNGPVRCTHGKKKPGGSNDSTSQPEGSNQTFVDLSDMACLVCGRKDKEDRMMLCEKCDGHYHCDCVTLRRVRLHWTCERCCDNEDGSQDKEEPEIIEELEGSSDDEEGLLAMDWSSKLSITDANRMRRFISAASKDHAQLKSKLNAAEAVLMQHDAETEIGPPQRAGSDPIQGGTGLFKRIREVNPRIRNVAVKAADFREQGYRYTVLTKGLDDIPNLPEHHISSNSDSDSEDFFDINEEVVIPDGDGANSDLAPEMLRIRCWLLRLVNALELPANPLDQLVESLGGPAKVAEMTGRKGYVAMEVVGKATYKRRNPDGPAKELNLTEKRKFQDGVKLVAIISDAASTGISLQADRRSLNQRRRVHITLELPWAADKAVQQFGRSHRANQASAPIYRLLVTPVGGEVRFASAAAKRLATLGALLRGDRNAVGAGTELRQFDVDSEEGRVALDKAFDNIIGQEHVSLPPGVTAPELPDFLSNQELLDAGTTTRDRRQPGGENATPPFFKYMRTKLTEVGLLTRIEEAEELDGEPFVEYKSERISVKKFLNRMLGMCLIDQQILFKFFTDCLDAHISYLKSVGRYDGGIVSIKGPVTVLGSWKVLSLPGGGDVLHTALNVDRGISWDSAKEFLNDVTAEIDKVHPGHKHLSGFYMLRGHPRVMNGRLRKYVILATEVIATIQGVRNVTFHIQRPHLGSNGEMTSATLQQKGYVRINDEHAARELWEVWYSYCLTHCAHGDSCRIHGCLYGMRQSNMHLLSGAVLPIWNRLNSSHWDYERNFTTKDKDKIRDLRISKVTTADDEPIVGLKVDSGEEMAYLLKNLDLSVLADGQAPIPGPDRGEERFYGRASLGPNHAPNPSHIFQRHPQHHAKKHKHFR